MILRCFITRNANVLLQAVTVYVRPLLEYNSVVWSPCLKCDINNIERVQRRYRKRLPGLRLLTYSERLRRLELISLELRRLHTDLIMCYKIVFGMLDVNFDDFFKVSPSSVTRGHAYKIFRQRGDISIREIFSASQRIVNVWNYLPSETADFTCLDAFKEQLN
jgi:hypothetical protein